jgi:formate dehydrogenase subunit delta
MSIEHLVQMANDIGHFFAAEEQRAIAVSGIANHLRQYWDPRMRNQIIAHFLAGGAGLEDLVKDAVATLRGQVYPGGQHGN